jgi:hypothetical protein
MLSALLALSSAAANCPDVSGSSFATRTVITVDCHFAVTNCFFQGLTAAQGGAIEDTGEGSILQFTANTFYSCSAAGMDNKAAYGGAISKLGRGEMQMDKCCFRDCQSLNYGLAINFASSSALSSSRYFSATIRNTNFVSCKEGGTSTQGSGTIHHENGLMSDYTNVNFSANTVSGAHPQGGSALVANWLTTAPANGLWTLVYCTFLRCKGQSIICDIQHGDNGDAPSITSCNFYDNTIESTHANRGLIDSRRLKLLISGCHFGGADQSTFVILVTDRDNARFRVQNCVFAGQMPSEGLLTDYSGNTQDAAATSLIFTHFHTLLCPTSTPTATPRPTFTPTPSQTCDMFNGRYLVHQDVGSDTICTTIENALFLSCSHNGDGGAVYLANSAHRLHVVTSSFIKCTCDLWGGALSIGTRDIAIESSCFRECGAKARATAFTIRGSPGGHPVATRCTFDGCAPLDEAAWCTIDVSRDDPFTFSYLNYTACRLSLNDGRGVVFRTQDDVNGPWFLRYSSVVDCSGAMGIHRAYGCEATIELCNVCNYTAKQAFLHAQRHGGLVDTCVFVQIKPQVFGMWYEDFQQGFDIMNCLFDSEALPVTEIYRSTTNNDFTVRPATFEIGHLPFQYCQLPARSRSPSMTCHEFTHPVIPRWATDTGLRCIVMRDCVFSVFAQPNSGDWGGCAHFGEGFDQVSVLQCAFHSVSNPNRGGALSLQSASADVNGSCFDAVTCTVNEPGNAMLYDRNGGVFNVLTSSFVNCGTATTTTKGTILIDKNADFSFLYLNFTECRTESAAPDGDSNVGFVFFAFANSNRPWFFRYSTVLKCSGFTGVHHREASAGTVEYCNFYANAAHADRGLLFSHATGMVVKYCIFDASGPEVYLDKGATVSFSMIGCVFSSTSLPASYVDTLSGNTFGENTASYPLLHLETFYCPATTPTPACVHFSGAFKRRLTVPDHSYCVILQDCLLSGIRSSSDGGGAYFGAGVSYVTISTSTFRQVSTSVWGGALFSRSAFLQIDACCFHNTSSDSAIHVLECDGAGTTVNVTGSSFVKCGSSVATAAGGTIRFSTDITFSIGSSNFSDCQYPCEGATGDQGAGFVFWRTGGGVLPWSFRFNTVLKCSGVTGLHYNADAVGIVEYCNFYDNLARGDRGVLFSYQCGMDVRSCVFNGNSRELWLNGGSKFSLTGCVLSSPLGSLNPDHFTDSGQNLFATTTASHTIAHLATGDCPVSSPMQTPIPTGTTPPNCNFYEGVFKESRVNVQDASPCVVIENAFFVDSFSSGHGGAVYLGGSTGPLFVRAVSFTDCRANWYGGGIYLSVSFIELDRCCFVQTRCGLDSGNPPSGNAIYLNPTDTVNQIQNSNFWNCGDANAQTRSTICFSTSLELHLASLNATAGYLKNNDNDWGTGYLLGETHGHNAAHPYAWTIRFCTVLNCSGTDAIHSHDNGQGGTVEYCNFYENFASRALLYAWRNAYTVRFCVFTGTARVFYLEVDSGTVFQIIGCVFSKASLISDAFARAETWGNRFGIETASLSLPHLPAADCPTEWSRSPTASDSPTATPSRVFSPSSHISASSKLVASPKISASFSLAPSATASRSGTCYVYAGPIESRIDAYGYSVCVVIAGCLFSGLRSSGNGGAACFGESVPYVTISSSTIRDVSTPAYGGALSSASPFLQIDACCFNKASSDSAVHVLDYNRVGATLNVTFSSFVACGSSGSTASGGTFRFQPDIAFSIGAANFSDCQYPCEGQPVTKGSVLFSGFHPTRRRRPGHSASTRS